MQDFQEELYKNLSSTNKKVTIFLKSGVRIMGEISGVDRFTVLILVNGKQQLIYKQAISTIAA
ncbi:MULTISPECIES: RNA chaperone Hfq [Bacillus cereus group]|uniref:RNA chaperone Hfq n=1 Tax=Bacillus cereus (strain G9842) TaxID=405531 RepID=B7IYR6_BACC2|nr:MULTISPECIES: RNA chaperone Hfq [Bacillus cereus group]ACK98489.1 RNA chaperone Hfq [Bacillus cereus G9842]MDR4137441.1 RNA chaperone Hfq [Bacillus cereus]MDR4368882.1 RNA chaperone Hfq [Bacillus cereus]PEE63320.1 RNA chaperone Hfq [Bacillus thuringiensis]